MNGKMMNCTNLTSKALKKGESTLYSHTCCTCCIHKLVAKETNSQGLDNLTIVLLLKRVSGVSQISYLKLESYEPPSGVVVGGPKNIFHSNCGTLHHDILHHCLNTPSEAHGAI